MQGARVGKNARVDNAIVGPNTVIADGAKVNVNGKEVVLLTGKVGK